ncbi:MAG: alpha/beta hydrolase [Actinomycetota bacterium]|nr:alpha/beta hydrolase [Actinomycetota bacterium]
MGDPVFETDILGSPYVARTLALRPDAEGEVVATLVHRPAELTTGRAVLHVHGFADYFFQTPAADFWTGRGYDFYALDLRRYGRSLRPHQTPNYTADLREYYEELDAAYAILREEHDQVVVSGHSTGGLTLSLWADDRRPQIVGAVLNSPWLDMQGSALMRVVGTQLVHGVGARRPLREIRRKVDGFYARSIHRDHEGEWDFSLDWKPLTSWPVYVGWLSAVRKGHRRVHRGIDVGAPVLVLSSAASGVPESMTDASVRTADIVLDVEQIRRWAPYLGTHVTLARIEGAIHDVTLSAEEPRRRVFDEIGRWLSAYVER